MSRYFLQLVLLAVFILPAANLNATHIVGGEIGYNCLGGDEYEIELSVYRDCFNGSFNAPFDNPAYIAVYDQFGVLVDNIAVPFMEDDTITSIITDPCLVIIEEVCVHTTTYRTTVTLPYLEGGYTLAYQRCCRNVTLENIVNPVETGATFEIELTEEAMLQCNNSPRFTEWPAIYICAEHPLEFDHSAFDVDGDNLVYSLCTPLSGGSLTTTQPIPASPPPYDEVVWEDGFGINNMLGVGEPLQIDPVSGLLTVTPGVTGQFVVGICVTEFDPVTGEILSETKRDFQYNVVVCGEKAAALIAPEAQCDDYVVCIENLSTNSTAYEWVFDYPDSTMFSTTDATDFCWEYPGPGTWTIRLIAEPNSICADTTYHEVFLQDNSLDASYQIDVFECDNIASLELMDLSTDNVSPPVAWDWEIIYGDPAVTVNSTDQNPSFLIPLGISGVINFTVTSQNGCVQSLSQTFETETTNPGDVILGDIEACIGDDVALNPGSPEYMGYTYSWEPAGLLDNPNAVNPVVNNVTGSQLFSVTITPESNACEIVREVQLTAVDLPVLDFSTFLECDGRTISFTNLSTNIDTFHWDFGDPGSGADNISAEVNPMHTFPDVGTYQVTLSVPDSELCTDMIMMNVTINETEVTADFNIEYKAETCAEDSVVVQFTDLSINTTASPITSWEWVIDPPGGVVMTGPNPTYTFTTSQTVDVTLTVTTADGCNSSSTQQNIEITLVENSDQFPDSLVVCVGESSQLLPSGNPDYVYSWSPTDGIDDPTSPAPTFFPDATTTYSVLVSHIGVDTCETVEEVVVFVTPEINLQVDGDGVLCTDQAMLSATTDENADIFWLDTGSGNTLATGLTYNFTITGTHEITVRAVDQYDCVEEEDIIVRFDPVDVAIPDTSAVCLGDELDVSITNLDPDNTLTYSWTPVDAFVPGTENDADPDVIEVIGEQILYVTVQNQFGCIYTDSVVTAVIDPNIELSFESEVQCDGSTVIFTNTSSNAFGYVWDFGDGSAPNYEESPTYNYGTSGEFIVTLSTVFDVPCETDAIDTVMTLDPEVTADFTYDIIECSPDSAVIALYDQTVSVFDIENWDWAPFGLNDQNPVVTLYSDSTLDVTLTITTSNGCMSSVTHPLNIQLVELALADTIIMCNGDTTQLNPGGNVNQTYNWSPAATLDDPTSANPNAFPTETTVYTVDVYAEGSDTCFYTDQITVFVPGDINFDLGDDIVSCGENVTIDPDHDVDVDIQWISVIDGPIGEGQTVTVNPFTVDTIIAIATDQYGCIDSDTIVVTDNGVDVAALPDGMTACSSVDTIITIVNIDPGDTLSYQWTPLEYIVSGSDEETVVVNVDEGCVTFSCLITNQNGCTETVSTTICVVPFEYQLPDTVYVCPNTPEGINPDGVDTYTFSWTPADNLSATDVANPIFTSNVPGSYTYTATISDNSGGIECETTDQVTVIVYPQLELATDGDTTLCEISTIPVFAETPAPSTINWYNEGNELIGSGSPIMVTPDEGTNIYTAIATDLTTNCTDTSEVTVQVNILDIGLPDSLVYVCSGVSTPINPNGDPGLIYEWNPDAGLDLTNPENPIVNITDTLCLEVTITDPVGECFLVRTMCVIPYPLILPETSPDTTLCELSPTILSVTSQSASATYEWFSDAGMNNSIGTGPTVEVDPPMPQFYYVQATDEFGCQEKDSVFVDRHPTIDVQAFGDTTLCEISTIPLWATTATDISTTTLEWYAPGADTSFATGTPIMATPGEGMNIYTVIAYDTNTECLDTATVKVTVNILEDGIPDSIFYVCSGVPTEINPNGIEEVFYEWAPDSNIIIDPPWNPTVITTDTITYHVTIDDPVGMCYLETSVTVIPYPLIEPVASADTAICDLHQAELSVTSSNPNATYVWHDSPMMTSEDSIGIGTTIVVNPDSTQYYYVVATDENMCSEYDSVLVVRYPPINLEAFGDTTLCEVATVPIWATTTELSDISWYTELPGTSFDQGDTVWVTPSEGTNTYIAVGTDVTTGCMDTTDVTIQVNTLDAGNIPDSIIYVCPNVETVIFTGNPLLEYTWDCDPEINTSDPLNPTVNTNDTINCIVTIVDPVGMCYLEVPVTIIARPEILPVITPPEVALCEHEDIELSVTSNAFPATYEWYIDTTLVGMDSVLTVNPPETTIYWVNVIDKYGCSETASVTVIRNPAINLETAGDTTLCEISPIELTAWTDLDEVTTIDWYEGEPLPDDPFDSGSPITVIPGLGTNIYTAIAHDTITGCLDTSQVIIQVNLLEVGIPDSIIYVCPNVPVAINPGGDSELNYIWSCDGELDLTEEWNPVVTTNDTIHCNVTIEDPVGMCYIETSVTIIPYPEINPVIAQDTIVCTFDPLELTVSSDIDGSIVTYTWYDDPGLMAEDQIGDGTSVIVNPSGTEMYYVLATDEFGCSEIDTVTVDAYPIQAQLLPQELIICDTQESEELSVVNNGPEEIVNYNWSPIENIEGEGANVTGLLTGTLNEFCVELTNEYGCIETECTTITMIDLMDSLTISAVPDTILLDDSSVLTVDGCTNCEYSWDWYNDGDLIPTDAAVVTATPDVAGDHAYDVYVSLLGCEQMLSDTVYVIDKICDESYVFLPSAFSPNDDGVNDELQLLCFFQDEIEMEIMIYNRWGEEIIRSTDPYFKWDGTYNGEQLPPDVFGFYLRVICPGGEELVQKGSITLLR